MEQAARTKWELKDKLAPRLKKVLPDRQSFPLVHGHAVAFPLAHVNDLNLPLDEPRALIFDADDLVSIKSKVVAAMKLWKTKCGHAAPRPLETRELKRLRKKALHPVFEIVETLGAHLQSDNRAMVRLSDELPTAPSHP